MGKEWMEREEALRSLVHAGSRRLPVDLRVVAGIYYIEVVFLSRLPMAKLLAPQVFEDDGFCTEINNVKLICINDKNRTGSLKKKGDDRNRFALAHNLGHFVLGHPMDPVHCSGGLSEAPISEEDKQANEFAQTLLAPLCVLSELNLLTPDLIRRTCNLPHEFAVCRARQLETYIEQHEYNSLEEQLLNQFSEYMESLKKKANR